MRITIYNGTTKPASLHRSWSSMYLFLYLWSFSWFPVWQPFSFFSYVITFLSKEMQLNGKC